MLLGSSAEYILRVATMPALLIHAQEAATGQEKASRARVQAAADLGAQGMALAA